MAKWAEQINHMFFKYCMRLEGILLNCEFLLRKKGSSLMRRAIQSPCLTLANISPATVCVHGREREIWCVVQKPLIDRKNKKKTF